jgi:deoxyinosine 3'endonuclease (endonuclease V)
VKKVDWYSKYVIGCYFNGVVLQSGNVLFQPNENIKTEDFEKSINAILGADVTYSDELYITRQKAISMIIESIKEGGK